MNKESILIILISANVVLAVNLFFLHFQPTSANLDDLRANLNTSGRLSHMEGQLNAIDKKLADIAKQREATSYAPILCDTFYDGDIKTFDTSQAIDLRGNLTQDQVPINIMAHCYYEDGKTITLRGNLTKDE